MNIMNPARTAKLLSRHASGLLTAPEVANTWLFDLVSGNGDLADAASSSAELPDEVQQELQSLLLTIRQAQYRWKPFMLGPGEEEVDPTDLRRICTLLDRDLVRTA